MTLYDPTSTFGVTTQFLTNYVTGNIYITFLIYVIILTAFLVSIKIEKEWIAILLFVVILALTSYLGDWLSFFGILLLFFTAVIAKRISGN